MIKNMQTTEERNKIRTHIIQLLESLGLEHVGYSHFTYKNMHFIESNPLYINFDTSDEDLLILAVEYVFNEGIRIGKIKKCNEIKLILDINGDSE